MNNPPDIDRELARRAAEGEDLAWREIYDATRERLFALICFHVGNREEALDILQETYVAAVRAIGSYRGDGSLESWLCGIALRRSRDWKRRVLRRLKQTLSIDDVPEIPIEHVEPDPLAAKQLHRFLRKLSGSQRQALLLREWMGYSFRDVGAALGIAEATARVHYHRGKERMRFLLEEAATSVKAVRAQEQQL